MAGKVTAGVRIFDYIEPLDAFVVSEPYRALAERLGLSEWHPAVWIGRLFLLDNDYGEHWFDNWDAREALAAEAAQMGLDPHELMIVVPDRMANGADGPCHPPDQRKRFWTDVLRSLELSYETLFAEARLANTHIKSILPEESIEDLEERIAAIAAELSGQEEESAPVQTARTEPLFTPRQGQYLAFIHTYTVLHGRPPAQADIQRYFAVTPPTVHQMILTLEQRGLLERVPGQARSIRVTVPPEELPPLG